MLDGRASDEGTRGRGVAGLAMARWPAASVLRPLRRSGRSRWFLGPGASLLVLLMSMTALPAEELELAPGDVLEFSVAGAPDLERKVPIDMDGMASFPLVGDIPTKARTLAQLRTDVRSLLSQKQYRQHVAGSARSSLDVIWPDQVALTYAEYRPVYINGDVAKPGEQKFKPGMTIRQALSLAGGYDILRFRMDNPFLDAADLRGSYEAAWIDYAREQARLQRLDSELGSEPARTASGASDLPVSPKLLGEIRSAEAAFKTADDGNVAKERDHIREMLTAADADIRSLTKRRDTEMSGSTYDEAEYSRINGLYTAGTLPMNRVAEARRVELLSATQALQSQVELERAVKDREILRRSSVALDDDRRMSLLKDKQAAQVKLADIRTKITATAEKMLYVGALKTQLARGTGGRPDLVLFRRGEPGRKVDEDAALQPGDVVEVALKVEATDAPVVH